MGRSKKFGRALNGVLIVDKPIGASSNAVLQRSKRLFLANKAGHTGSLDPLATGVLPVCFGESTKFSQFLLDSDKTYTSTFKLGIATDTADAEGKPLFEANAAAIQQRDVEQAIAKFSGNIDQLPPMYSAIKKNGRPLYELARQGIDIERSPRQVNIMRFELLAFRPGTCAEADVAVHCSKGTYIRSLAADIGDHLGVGGHVSSLRRTAVGPFSLEGAKCLSALEQERGDGPAELLDKHLLPIDAAIQHLPALHLDPNSGHYFSHGQAVMCNQVYRIAAEGDTVRVFQAPDIFLGVGEITDEGSVSPKRLVATKS